MKTPLVASAALLFAVRAFAEVPTVAACNPHVSVLIPSASKASTPIAHREVVHVYWDVSKSMRDFHDLNAVVDALDSSVLLLAHASSVEQFGVGATIEPLPSARSALHPRANRTALHLAAERIGRSLAAGDATAAVIVSDLELDTPPRSASGTTVCGGVPLPSTPLAGSLFGRCFERAVLASDSSLTRANLLVHVFRKASHGRELFILLFATDRAFGLRISDEVTRRLDFARHVIFDSGAIGVASVRGCTLSMPSPDVLPRMTNGCGAKCFDRDAVIEAACDVRHARGAWIDPSAVADNGVRYEAEKVRFAVPCGTPPGRFTVGVSFNWQPQLPWLRDRRSDFARNPSVRDLFESLTAAIVNTVAPRRLRIGVDLAP